MTAINMKAATEIASCWEAAARSGSMDLVTHPLFATLLPPLHSPTWRPHPPLEPHPPATTTHLTYQGTAVTLTAVVGTAVAGHAIMVPPAMIPAFVARGRGNGKH